MSTPPDIIYGRHALVAAMPAGEELLEIHVAEGARARGALGVILKQARTLGIPVKRRWTW